MRILLDTTILLWAVAVPARLDRQTRDLLQDRDNDVSFSVVSIWEIAIKFALGRPNFGIDPKEVLAEAIDAGFRELAIPASVATMVATLPLHHRDPFDRLLLVQAISQPARFLTADAVLSVYSELVTLIQGRPS